MPFSSKNIMIFDGGMGSELVKCGVDFSIPEDLNITNAALIRNIHLSYSDADFITTNTFGLNKYKYKGNYLIQEVAARAIENARITGVRVFFDIGPTGQLLKPFGTLSFDDAYACYREVVIASRETVDGYIVETFSDLYELKAALLAVKENSDKPVFATMTFDKSGRTLTGTTPEIMVAFLEQIGVDALGVNCSLGPKELYPIVERILKVTHTPVIVQPNRGIPRLVDGEHVYDVGVEEFTEYARAFAKMGVSILGGCCGTTPEFISSIATLKGLQVNTPNNPPRDFIASYSKTIKLSSDTERATVLLDSETSIENIEDIIYDTLDEIDDGAEVICLTADGTSPETVKAFIEKLQELTNTPIVFDTKNAEATAIFKRYYNGVI